MKWYIYHPYIYQTNFFFIFMGWNFLIYNYKIFFIILWVYLHWLYIFGLCWLIWLMTTKNKIVFIIVFYENCLHNGFFTQIVSMWRFFVHIVIIWWFFMHIVSFKIIFSMKESYVYVYYILLLTHTLGNFLFCYGLWWTPGRFCFVTRVKHILLTFSGLEKILKTRLTIVKGKYLHHLKELI